MSEVYVCMHNLGVCSYSRAYEIAMHIFTHRKALAYHAFYIRLLVLYEQAEYIAATKLA